MPQGWPGVVTSFVPGHRSSCAGVRALLYVAVDYIFRLVGVLQKSQKQGGRAKGGASTYSTPGKRYEAMTETWNMDRKQGVVRSSM